MSDAKAKPPQSHIPVKAARPAALNSSFSSPHFGIGPPTRHLSVGDSPTHPSPGSSPSASGTGGGLTSFRSFRNLLPFGPHKHQTPNLSPGGPSRSSFGLNTIRKSIHGERSVSAPQLRQEKSQEDFPVLTIELSQKPFLDQEELQKGLGLYTTKSETTLTATRFKTESTTVVSHPENLVKKNSPILPRSAPASAQVFSENVSSPNTLPVGTSDLSTILESDTSGISKHIPTLDDSQDIQPNERRKDTRDHTCHRPNQSFLIAPPDQRDGNVGWRTPASQDTSALDLSTSKVSNEVLAALADEGGRPHGWLDGVVVDDIGDTQAIELGVQDADTSFDFGAVDPDLAALLSPNRVKSNEPALLVALDSLAPPFNPSLANSRRPSPQPSPQILPSGLDSQPLLTATTVPSPVLTARSVASHSSPIYNQAQLSPVRRSTSLSRSTGAKIASSSNAQRLARSVSEHPSPNIRSTQASPTIQTSPLSRASDVGDRPPPAALLSRRKGLPAVETHLPRRPTSGGSEEPRRSAASRLVTPGRPSLHLTPSNNSRPFSRNTTNGGSPSSWDADSVSPSSRAPSSLGATSARLQLHARPSLDGGSDRLRGMQPRTRDRSASVTESPHSSSYRSSPTRPPVTEWLGPRTAKAFAAAGLLDLDRDTTATAPATSRPGSRFGTTRSHSDRDFRSQYAPSRMAFSEAGSGSSWGRRSGSISRAGGTSDASPMSETVSTPRTTFSAASTAPTSISASSSVQHHLQNEINILQEKHTLETGALLNALADSQRTTKVLREENVQLRDRIQDLENRLADAMEQIQRMQYSQNAPSAYSRPSYHRPVMPRPTEAVRGKRIQPQSGLATLLHPDIDSDQHLRVSPDRQSLGLPDAPRSSADSHRDSLKSHRRRFSTSSSIFPVPSSTMSMLLHEEGLVSDTGYSSRSRSPPSPTVVLNKLPNRSAQSLPSGHHRNSSSGGNISPTTASFSMATGSPVSLNLRPEHERLLGDMPSLDLRVGDYEFQEDDVG
ncbi:hypothetical protein C8Q75DRAFT_740992 [Abortiporus biennis]|nr:hypothetical protein C8Q75DRAFT_740992 [Abortiporus biennis]